jgi:hypothetical protein
MLRPKNLRFVDTLEIGHAITFSTLKRVHKPVYLSVSEKTLLFCVYGLYRNHENLANYPDYNHPV